LKYVDSPNDIGLNPIELEETSVYEGIIQDSIDEIKQFNRY